MPKTKKDLDTMTADEVLATLIGEGMQVAIDVPDQEWVSTGNMAIDSITNGGIPLGKVTELAGPNASGKTTTAGSAAANVISSGIGRVLFCDYERALDKAYFQSLGVPTEDKSVFTYAAFKTLEEGANAVRKLVKTGEYRMVIFDSVAKMITERERSGDVEVGMNLERSKLMYAFLRQAVDYAADNNCALVFLNHLLEKVDISFMGQKLAAQGIKQYTTPGGNAIPFFSSLRLFYKKIGDITSEVHNPITNEVSKTKIGYKHEVRVAKNKLGKPEGVTQVINIMGEGFSQNRTALEVLKAYGNVKKNGAWYSAKDSRLSDLIGTTQVQGEENFYQVLFGDAAARGTAISIAQELLRHSYESLEASPENSESENDYVYS